MTDQFQPPQLPPDGGRTGPVWETSGPLATRFLETVRGVLLNPVEFYRTMRRRGGVGAPLTFGIAGTLVGGVIGALYQLMFMTMGGGFGDFSAARDTAFVGLLSSGCIVVILPLAGILWIVIAAGIYHLMLLLLGGARGTFETTLRVVAYTMGATSLLQILPMCGSFLAAVWSIVVNIIGLAQAHEVSTGKAAAAVLVPIVACCVVIGLVWAATIAAILGGAGAFGR
jgi:hypothetical protein